MSAHSKRLTVQLARIALAAGLALPVGAGAAFAAEQKSADDIIQALKPAKRITRSLTAPAATARSAEDARFVDSLRNRTTRSLTTDEREKITDIAKKKPSIDLEITFDFDSAVIGTQALPQVKAIGQALTSHELKGGTFLVAGHTDGKGSDTYNQALSERRADAVKRFLAERYRIDPNQLVTVGYGETQLKVASDPLDGDNRRVQLVNMTDK